MANTDAVHPSFSARRKWLTGLTVGAGIAAVFALVVMVNYLAARYYTRVQWTSRPQIELSPQTLRVIRSITNDVKLTVFFDTAKESDLHGLITSLLKEYNYLNRKISFETVDPTRNPAKAELVLAAYKLSSLKDKNFVVVDCGGRTKVLYQSELADYRLEPVAGGEPNEYRKEMVAFKGELDFTTAMFNLANPREFKVFFLLGHGEHDPEKVSDVHGYAKFAEVLKEKNNIRWQKLPLYNTNDIPGDCQLLIIAGPQVPFDEQELTKIDNYLKQGGRLFVLLNSMVRGKRSGLESVLERWGVAVLDDVIYDVENSPTGKDLLAVPIDLQHPIMKALVAASEDMRVRLVLPRAVGRLSMGASNPNAPEVKVLAGTSDNATEISDIRDGVQYPNPSRDRRGRFPLITVVEQGGVKGVSAARGAMRMVVVGDSFCLDNEMFDTAGNHYFGAMAVNWLLDRPQILLDGLLPQPLKEYKLLMTKQQMQTVQWILLGAMPGAVLLLGGLVWWRRRR